MSQEKDLKEQRKDQLDKILNSAERYVISLVRTAYSSARDNQPPSQAHSDMLEQCRKNLLKSIDDTGKLV